MPDNLGGSGAQEHPGDRTRVARADHQQVAVSPLDIFERFFPVLAMSDDELRARGNRLTRFRIRLEDPLGGCLNVRRPLRDQSLGLGC